MLGRMKNLDQTRQVTSLELTEMYLARLHRDNPLLNNVVTFLDDYGRTVLGASALTSLSPLRNQGLGRFSMKNTGRMIAYDGKPRPRVVSSTGDLLSKWGMPVLRSAAA